VSATVSVDGCPEQAVAGPVSAAVDWVVIGIVRVDVAEQPFADCAVAVSDTLPPFAAVNVTARVPAPAVIVPPAIVQV